MVSSWTAPFLSAIACRRRFEAGPKSREIGAMLPQCSNACRRQDDRYFLALSEARRSIGGEPAKMIRPVGMEFKSAVVGAISDQTSSNLS